MLQVISLLDSLDTTLCCRHCSQAISKMAHVVSVTQEGPGGTFVNPHGYVHDMLCVQHVSSAVMHGSPETANSWFAGYAWTCITCAVCDQHLGWRFTKAVGDVQPAAFYGLCRASVQHGHAHSAQTSEHDLDGLV